MRAPGAAAFVLAASLGRAAAGAADPAALLPTDGFAPGWSRSGAPTAFAGSDLYNLIDGAAEVFLELGFDRVASQDYTRGRDALTVEIYAMADEVAAAGVYLLKCGREERHAGVPGRHAFTPRQVVLYRGNVLVIVTSQSGRGAEAATVAAAAAVAAKLPAERPVPLADLLPAEGRRAGTERLARGPFSLQRVYTFGEGDVLSLGGRTAAVAASYDDGRGGAFTRIAVVYPDGASAAAAFVAFRARLDPSLEVLAVSDETVVFRDAAGRFGSARRHATRLDLEVDRIERPPQ